MNDVLIGIKVLNNFNSQKIIVIDLFKHLIHEKTIIKDNRLDHTCYLSDNAYKFNKLIMYCHVQIKAWVTFTLPLQLKFIAAQSMMIISHKGVYFINQMSIGTPKRMLQYTIGLIITPHHWLKNSIGNECFSFYETKLIFTLQKIKWGDMIQV